VSEALGPSTRPERHVQKSAAWGFVSEEYRLALCGRCRVQLRLCGRCDRGQRFCGHCGPVQRQESVRRAGAAYRVRPRARRLQAARQARYRDRQRAKFSDRKVTHQSVTQEGASKTASLTLEIGSSRRDQDDVSIRELNRCSICGVQLSSWSRRWRRARSSAPQRRRAPRVPRGPPS